MTISPSNALSKMEDRRRMLLLLVVIVELSSLMHSTCAEENISGDGNGRRVKNYESVLAPVFERRPKSTSEFRRQEPNNRRVLDVGSGQEVANNVDDLVFDINYGDDVTRYSGPLAAAPSYADPSLLSAVMHQADQANFRYPIWTTAPPIQDLDSSGSAANPSLSHPETNEINPFGLFPPEFHDLLNIPLHTYKNGSIYNPNERYKHRPFISAGYANMKVQGGPPRHKPESETPSVSYRPKPAYQSPVSPKTPPVTTYSPSTTRNVPTRFVTSEPVFEPIKTTTKPRRRPALSFIRSSTHKPNPYTLNPTRHVTRPSTKSQASQNQNLRSKLPFPDYDEGLKVTAPSTPHEKSHQDDPLSKNDESLISSVDIYGKYNLALNKTIYKHQDNSKLPDRLPTPARHRPDRLPPSHHGTRNRGSQLRYTRRPSSFAPTRRPAVPRSTTSFDNILKTFETDELRGDKIRTETDKMQTVGDLDTHPEALNMDAKPPSNLIKVFTTAIPDVINPLNNNRIVKDKFIPSKQFVFPSYTEIPTQPPFAIINEPKTATFIPIPPTPRTTTYRPIPPTPKTTTYRPIPPTPTTRFRYQTVQNYGEVLPPVFNSKPLPYPLPPSDLPPLDLPPPDLPPPDLPPSELPPPENTKFFIPQNFISKLNSDIPNQQSNSWPNIETKQSIQPEFVLKQQPILNRPFPQQPPPGSHLKSRPGPLQKFPSRPQYTRKDTPYKRTSTRTRPPPLFMKDRPKFPERNDHSAGIIDSGFILPDEAGNLPPKNTFGLNKRPSQYPKQSILPQFRPNVGQQDETFGFNPPPRVFSSKVRPPQRPNRRTQVVRNRPSFLENFNFFGRTPVNRRRGESGQIINTNRINGKHNPTVKKNEEVSEYLLSHGPVPIHTKKVVVIGPFDGPPPGAPLIVPDQNPHIKKVPQHNNIDRMSSGVPIGLFPPPPLPPMYKKYLRDPSVRTTDETNNILLDTKTLQDKNKVMKKPDSKVPLSSRVMPVSGNGYETNQLSLAAELKQPGYAKVPHSPQPPKDLLQQSIFNVPKVISSKLNKRIPRPGRTPAVVYGKPTPSQSHIIRGNIGNADVRASFNVSKSKPQRTIYSSGRPPFIDNVTKEDKEAIIAAKFYFPNLNTVQRSGQNKVIPLPIPILTNDMPKRHPYHKKPIAADRRIVVETNFDGQRLSPSQVKYKQYEKPAAPSLFMLPPPPRRQTYFQNKIMKFNSTRPDIVNSSLKRTKYSKPEAIHHKPHKIDKIIENTSKPNYIIDNEPDNLTKDNIVNSKESSADYPSVKVKPGDFAKDMSLFVSEPTSHVLTSPRPVYRPGVPEIFKFTTQVPSRPMRITEFNPYANRTPIPTQKPIPQSFVEPIIPEHSYGGWVVVGQSHPDSINPVVGYVKENTPNIKIKQTIDDDVPEETINPKINSSEKSARLLDDAVLGSDIITGTPEADIIHGHLVQYSTRLSIEAPDVVNSYLIPNSEQIL